MSWSLSPVFRKTPLWADRALRVAGRCLYLANAYESKCAFILSIAEISNFAEANPRASPSAVLASASRTRLLGQVVGKLKRQWEIADRELELLERARDARNFIAHEGAAFGYVFQAERESTLAHLEKLRGYLRDLIAGDNLVSTWVYEIEEKEPAPASISDFFAREAESWAFEPASDA